MEACALLLRGSIGMSASRTSLLLVWVTMLHVALGPERGSPRGQEADFRWLNPRVLNPRVLDGVAREVS